MVTRIIPKCLKIGCNEDCEKDPDSEFKGVYRIFCSKHMKTEEYPYNQ